VLKLNPETFHPQKMRVYLRSWREVLGSDAINYSKIPSRKGNKVMQVFFFVAHRLDSKHLAPLCAIEISAVYGKSIISFWKWVFGFTTYFNSSCWLLIRKHYETIDKVVFGAFFPLRGRYRYQKTKVDSFLELAMTLF